MPIPQLKRPVKKSQNWRINKKKYYISRQKKDSWFGTKSKSKKNARGFGNGKNLFSKNFKKKALFFVLFLALVGILSGLIMIAWLSRSLPDPNRLIEREIAQSTKIYDRTGKIILYEIHGDEQRTLVKLDEIPDYVKWATIAIEDKDFYKHKGFSLWAIFRTVITNVLRGQKAGGSTLTQQFIKNSVLTSEKTYTRKIKELLLAYKLEKRFSKDEILQMYLNEIPYGSTAYGIDAASQRYFGKSARDINIAEAAVLAALPQAPSRYSPYGSNKESLFTRQVYILDLMAKYGYIKEEEAETAKGVELQFREPTVNITAPHFVMYVKEILSEKYGEKMIEQGGLKIWTTLDLYKHGLAEEVIKELAPKNKEKYNASNAALIVLDPKTGQILSMVGSRDYFSDEIDGQVNITTSKRQPGSSLKPLIYASAFLRGYTPDTILYDVVTNFSHNPAEPYEPHNYDNHEHGPVTMRKALAGSLNIPAVKSIYLAGIDNVLDLTQDLGYTTLDDRNRFGLSLVLGGGEVKLIEHANAYSVFAREGLLQPITAILKIEDADGDIIEEYKSREKRVLDPKIARLINNILSDNNARAYAFGERNWLTLGSRPVAAKTGTTNDYRDAWTIGYTPSIIAGVWVGNNDNSPMKRGAAGGTVAAPIWHDFMKKVLGDTPIEYFRKPEIQKTNKPVLDGETGMAATFKIDTASGLLATEFTPENFIEEKSFFKPHCLLYYVNKNDPLGNPPKDPSNDPQFELWENRIIEWAAKQEQATSTPAAEPPPTEYDNLHIPENLPTLEIITPGNNQAIMEPLLVARIKTTAPRGVNRVEYYINDNMFYTNHSYPFNLEKRIDFLKNGFHNLKISVCDDIDNCTVKKVEFNVILDETINNKNISISLLEPSNGLAVSNIDFPLNLKLNITEPSLVAKINFYYLAESSDELNLIASVQPVEDNIITRAWDNIPLSNTYKIYSEAIGWDKQIIKSNKIIIIVNNIIQGKGEVEEEKVE